MADQTPNNPTNPPTSSGAAGGEQPPAPRKKARWGRRILIAAGVVVVLLVVLVLLIPTIASMGFVRSIVVGKINDNLNGKVAIDNWSLGWTGGIDVNGVSVVGPAGEKVVDVKKVHTDLSLLDAIRGRYDLGKVVVDGLRLNVVKYDDGTTNLQKLAKSQPSGPSQEQPAPSQPPAQQGEAQAKGQLPNVSADVVLTDCQATVSGAGIPQPVNAAFGGEVKVPGINQAMTDTINAALTIGGKAAGKVDLSGTADVFENNQFDDKTASASQKLNIQGLQLASVAALLPTTAVDALRGVTDGNLMVDLKNGSDGTLQGQVVTRDVSVSGPALNGDTFQSDAVGLTIPATSIAMPNGLADSAAYHVRTGGGSTLAPIVVSLGKTPKGEEIGGAQVLVDAQVEAIQNAFAGKAPGSAGKVEVSDNLDIAALARMMPRTLKVVEGVQVQSGKLTQQNTVALTPQRGTIHAVTDVSAVSAVDTKANKPITIRPIHLDASAAAGGGGATDFRDIALNLTSGFATASFKGQTLADLAGKAHGDLKAMHDEVGQVVDFGKLDLAGTFDMTLASSGNLAEENGRGKVQTQMTLQNLRVAGLADGKTVDQKWMNVTAGADLERGQTKFINAINNAVVTIKSGDPNNPTIDVVTNANVNLGGETATVGFAIQKLFVDAARAQTEFAAFVPGDYRVTSGTVSASAVGTWSGGTLKLDNFTAQPANLTVNLQGKDGRSTPVVNGLTMNAEAAGTVATGQQQTVNLTKLSVVEQNKRLMVQKVSDGPLVLTNGPNGFSGNGKLHVGADLAFVNSVVQAVSSGGQQVVAQSKAGEVRSGALDGTLGFDSASGKPTNLVGDFKIADLVVTTAGGGATQPETVTLTLQATAPSDFATVSAPKVSVTSRFANLNVTDALLKLKDPSNPNAAVGTFDKFQKANVAVDVTDVGTVYSIAGAFMPAAAATTAPSGQAAPVEPLAVSGGHAKANVVIARNNGVTTLNVSDVSGGEIQLRRGNRSYTVQPFTAELAAAVKDSGDQIAQVDVSKLAAKTGVADVTMEQPISIKNPGGDQMAATGALRVAGQIRPASDLLAVVQGKPLPYNGAYVMVQKLNTEGSTVGLAGNVDLTNFQVLDDQGQVSFAEDKVAVTNDLKIDQKAKNVAGNLNVDSKALGVKFNGGVNQFDTTRSIVDGTTLALNYDAAKVWQVVRPMLSPETRENLGDVQVTGVKQVTFKLGGSYPANEPFQQAVAKLNASGALPLDTLTLPTKGIDAKQINPGFTLAGGKLTLTTGPGAATVTAAAATTKPGAGGGPMVVTAMVNGGSVDLSNAVVDLTTPEPRLSTPPNKALAHNVGMNPVLAGYANKAVPVFDTTTQTALVDVTVVRCDKLPLGSAMTTPNNGGYAEIVVSLTNVRPGGPIIGGINQFVGGFFGNSVQAAVEPTTIAISDGMAKVNNFALVVGAQQHQTLKLDGTVSLADNGPLNLTANIPSDMIKRFGKDILKYLPQGVDLPIAGTKEHPQFADADKVLASLAKQALTNAAAGALGGKGGKNGKGGGLGDIIGDVLGGNDQNQKPAQPQQQQQQKGQQQQQQQAQPQPESPADAIGGLLNSLTQDRDSKKDKKKKK